MEALFRHLEKKGYPPPVVFMGATPSCSVLPKALLADVTEEAGKNYRSLLRLFLFAEGRALGAASRKLQSL